MSDEQLAQIERKVDGLVTGMAGLNGRLAGLEDRLTDSVTGLKASVVELKAGQDALAAGAVRLEAKLDATNARLEAKLDTMGAKLGVQLERATDQIKLLAEGHTGIIQQMDRRFDEQRADIREIVAPLMLSIGAHTKELLGVRRIPRTPGRGPRARRTKRRRT